MLKRLIIWIMLIAFPLQNYAAAAMMHCAPMHEAMAAQVQHHHEAMKDMGMSNGHEHHHSAADMADGGHNDTHSAGANKCSACSTCCMSVMAATFPPLAKASLLGAAVLIPHPVLALPSITLDGPQRPPRTFSLS